MAVKTTGAEFKRFYDDATFWPDDTWHDDTEFTVDGVDQPDGIDTKHLNDSAAVVIIGGFMCGPQWEDGDGPTLEAYFKRWRKQQTTVIFNVECDKSIVEAVKAAIKQVGGKIS